ncbi:MAG: glutaredoxin domain-containing protein [Candidatus Bathyarchaeia archaeon]
MANIIYTKVDCPSCTNAKMYLKQKGVTYERRDFGSNPIGREAACDLAGKFDSIIVKRGESVQEYLTNSLSRQELGDLVVHPVDGLLRVPALLSSNKLVIGFNEKAYNMISPKTDEGDI